MSAQQRFFSGLDYRTGDPITIEVEGGTITAVHHPDAIPGGCWIAPGLVDLQVNGFRGADFNSPALTRASVRQVTEQLWQEGVTSFLPTVITNRFDRIEAALAVVSAVIEEPDLVAQTLVGIHLEGPFISPEDGPRGAHDVAYVQRPEWSLFERWQQAAGGRIRLTTLSPEWPNAAEFIAQCVQTGVKVAIGHTAADSNQIAQAVRAGASLSTHLGNGAHPVLPRHPNYIWDQLATDELWAGMIADGFHLPPAVLKVIAKVKQERTVLVSDAVDLAGLPAGLYETYVGGQVVLTPEGKLHLAERPELLAGSVKTLRQGVATLVRAGICSLQEAWDMASIHPASYLGLATSQGIVVGGPADFVLFEHTDQDIEIIQTVKAGHIVFDALADPTLADAAVVDHAPTDG